MIRQKKIRGGKEEGDEEREERRKSNRHAHTRTRDRC